MNFLSTVVQGEQPDLRRRRSAPRHPHRRGNRHLLLRDPARLGGACTARRGGAGAGRHRGLGQSPVGPAPRRRRRHRDQRPRRPEREGRRYPHRDVGAGPARAGAGLYERVSDHARAAFPADGGACRAKEFRAARGVRDLVRGGQAACGAGAVPAAGAAPGAACLDDGATVRARPALAPAGRAAGRLFAADRFPSRSAAAAFRRDRRACG